MEKYLVIGNPIEHSLSPRLQNHWLKQSNIKAVYDKIKLEENEIKEIIQDIKKQKIAGCNVTVPFKRKVIPFLDVLSHEADQTQSVNTIIFKKGKLIGYNTDIIGFDKAIKNLNFNIQGKNIFILGAGGVAPSIVFALQEMGVSEITITNRTKQKAESLKILFKNLRVVEWGNLIEFDVVINATSLGLNNEKINFDFSKVGKNKLFYDVIYNPAETNFLKEGKKIGSLTENGRAMFIYQAAEAFKLWHGIEPKVNEETLKLFKDD